MKKYTPALVALLASFTIAVSASAFAQTSKQSERKIDVDLPISCYDKDLVLESLSKNYGEVVYFAGIDDLHEIENMSSFLALNRETMTYSFGFFLLKRGLICMVSAGEGMFDMSKLMSPKENKERL
jgi:hypothetical protein